MKGQESHASLLRLMWWSLRLGWSKNKEGRRKARRRIWAMLEARWMRLVPEAVPGDTSGVTRAVWLGAALASRSLIRYPLLPRKLKSRLIWLVRLVGRNNGKALVTAYLAWAWMRDVAESPSTIEAHASPDTI
ncbi:hypothetical protein [Sulfobacillus sp. hq2]|uniref:hypothetical protein n=1 Tax=Sulfobacillus sp. hq2 TaxID=2039167 RepID=UPI000CD05A85|nr:hypothetical protein [Sulfobacillus sp. hq2]POB09801.1 hypothetical protein CO251_12935 [Sulfobacillus sp. hq2]